MPVFAAAVCPHPPVLVPELASGAASELEDLRATCDAAVTALCQLAPDVLVVLGTSDTTVRFGPRCGGSFAPWGVDLRVGAPEPDGEPLPLSLAVGAWLLERAGCDESIGWAAGRGGQTTGVVFQSVAIDAPPSACVALGSDLARTADRVALLVMGDGSACRGDHAPGRPDPRAEPFDTLVASALAVGDVPALLALDPALAAELHAAGRAAWQVLAGATVDGRFVGALRYASAPYGVGYFVASWRSA